jgi:hypothetical protein
MVLQNGSMRKATGIELYKRHKELGKEIPRVRQLLCREEFSRAKQSYYTPMPVNEADKRIYQMLCQDSGATPLGSCKGEWQPPKPTFSSAEHERIAEVFFGPDAESLTGEEALLQRVKAVKDPSRSRLSGAHSSRKEATVVGV